MEIALNLFIIFSLKLTTCQFKILHWFHISMHTNTHTHKIKISKREGLERWLSKSTSCSCRGHRFDSQNPHGAIYNSSPRDLISSDLHGHQAYTYRYTYRHECKNIHTYDKWKYLKRKIFNYIDLFIFYLWGEHDGLWSRWEENFWDNTYSAFSIPRTPKNIDYKKSLAASRGSRITRYGIGKHTV